MPGRIGTNFKWSRAHGKLPVDISMVEKEKKRIVELMEDLIDEVNKKEV